MSALWYGCCHSTHTAAGAAHSAPQQIAEACALTSAACLQHSVLATNNCIAHAGCRYVYERLTLPGRKPTFVTLMVTQLVSGVWHGLYPGYIMFFAGGCCCCCRQPSLYLPTAAPDVLVALASSHSGSAAHEGGGSFCCAQHDVYIRLSRHANVAPC